MRLQTVAVPLILILQAACQAETFTPSGPTGLQVIHGPPAAVSLGTELDTMLQVRVVDDAGAPLEGVAVHWRMIDGDGELIPTDTLSGVDGLVMARWKFRYIPGLQRAQVQVEGLDPVTFTTEARGFRAVQVTAGYTHACALDGNGSAWCWNGDSVRRGAPGRYNDIRPSEVTGDHTFVEIQAGDAFTCGRTAAGEVWCWGEAWSGAFGPGLTSSQSSPVRIEGLPPLSKLRTGEGHSCGSAADSTTWCWGRNDAGQSGSGGPVLAPTQVVTALQFVDLAAGSTHTCGVTAIGEAYCWGSGAALGDGGPSRSAPTTPVAGGHRFVELKAGDRNSCGRTIEGETWCWGAAELGGAARPTPVRLELPSATSLAIGSTFVGVTTMGGGVRLAPAAGYQLPAEIQMLGVAQLAGRGSFCLISRAGDVYCSGSIVDQISCSSVSPFGCAPTGPIPLPSGGRVYGYPPFGD